MHRLATLCAVGAFLAAPAHAMGDLCSEDEVRIVFVHDAPERGHPKGEAASFLAELVNAELDGRACMEVVAEAPGYSDATVAEGLTSGAYHLAAPALGNLGHLSRRYLIFDLPFLFKDLDAVFAYQENSTGQALLTEGTELGLLGLAYWADGMKEISATRQIRMPDDAAGVAFGIQESEIEADYFETLNAEPVEVPVGELSSALEAGTVEGQNMTMTNIAARALHYTQAAVTDSNHGLVQYMLMTSPEFWESLDPTLRADLELLIAIVSQERNRFAIEM
ncbi:MAG: TRAP transporter substrate-binding protein DctP, partial [Pseudomonadota bacterium]